MRERLCTPCILFGQIRAARDRQTQVLLAPTEEAPMCPSQGGAHPHRHARRSMRAGLTQLPPLALRQNRLI